MVKSIQQGLSVGLLFVVVWMLVGPNLTGGQRSPADRISESPPPMTPSSEADSQSPRAASPSSFDRPVPENTDPPADRDGPARAAKSTQDAPSKPSPRFAESAPEDPLTRVLRDHFTSHPTTERRIVHLRGLAQGKRRLPASDDPDDLVGLFIEIKNTAARLGTEVFTEVAGPLSLEEEWILGNRVHRQVVETLEIDQEESARMARLAEPLLRHRKRTQARPYKFHVIKDSQFNAFAHLGGHVYVFQGLLDLIQDETQLQFVLAHEIAHIELQQCAKMALPGALAEKAAGNLGKVPTDILNRLVQLSYSEDEELQADSWAYRTLSAEGRTDTEILAFFQQLLEIESNQTPQ